MSFKERRFNDVDPPLNLKAHDGPTLILVKTAEWPSKTSATFGATRTASQWATQKADARERDSKHKGMIAGIVLGVLVFVTMLLSLCCWKCGCCKWRDGRGKKISKERQEMMVEEGLELMAKQGAGKTGVTSAEVALMGPRGSEETKEKVVVFR